jgi:hypothetical protein
MLILSLSSVIICAQQKYYRLSGRIRDANDGTDLVGANVIILNTTLGGASNVNGDYWINKIPEGKYVIRISRVDMPARTDTVIFSGDNKSIERNYKLGYFIIQPEQISEIKEYFNNLKLSAGNKQILNIYVDSLFIGKDSLGITATVVNNTNYPVYISSPLCGFALFFEIKESGSYPLNWTQS